MWSGSELVVVWIGSGSGSGSAQKWTHMFVYVAAWMQHDKKRTTRCASSKCTAWLLGRLALRLATVSVLQFDSLDAQQLQLGCWTSWLLGSVALQQFVAWLLGRVNNCRAGNPKIWNHHWTKHQLTNTLYHSKGLDQRSGSNPFEWSGSEVWIGGLDRVWDRGLIQTLHFEPQPTILRTMSWTEESSCQWTAHNRGQVCFRRTRCFGSRLSQPMSTMAWHKMECHNTLMAAFANNQVGISWSFCPAWRRPCVSLLITWVRNTWLAQWKSMWWDLAHNK